MFISQCSLLFYIWFIQPLNDHNNYLFLFLCVKPYLFTAFGEVKVGGIKPCRAQELCKSLCWFDVWDCRSLWRMGSEKSDSCPCCWGFHHNALDFSFKLLPLCHNWSLVWNKMCLVVLSQIVRREGLELWQELLPSLVSLSSKGPVQVSCMFSYLQGLHFYLWERMQTWLDFIENIY